MEIINERNNFWIYSILNGLVIFIFQTDLSVFAQTQTTIHTGVYGQLIVRMTCYTVNSSIIL